MVLRPELRREDARLDRLSDPSSLGDVDESDPASVARWAKRLGGEMGEDLGDEFDDAMDEMARLVNTSSGAGLQGSVGQSAYSAAKAAIAALTLVQAAELARYGITANAIAPSARTRMTETAFAEMMRAPADGFDAMDPANVSPLVAWLASTESKDVTGQVFEVAGGALSVADGWRSGPRVDKGARFAADEIGGAVHELLRKAVPPQKVYGS